MIKEVMIFFLLCPLISAQGDLGSVVVIPSGHELFGYCDTGKVGEGDLTAVGQCISNYFNPSLPNPLMIIDSIRGDELEQKIKYLNPLPENYGSLLNPINLARLIGGIGMALIKIPILLGYTLLQLLTNVFRYCIVFLVRFVFVYLFYVSLGFQTLLVIIDRNSKTLEHPHKVQLTLIIMCVGFIITLGGGLW